MVHGQQKRERKERGRREEGERKKRGERSDHGCWLGLGTSLPKVPVLARSVNEQRHASYVLGST